MEHENYKCPKCGNKTFEVDEFRATGGIWTKLLDIQNKRFTTVSCSKCHFTEIYKTNSSAIGNIFDFFTS
ncbi:MAG: zinc ribbon domain-containing protein [Cyclobacteriaceae bacterium]|nr:zinc ribbon domain-containing protein [Cyclobacteriaceae bacterium]